MAAALEFIKHHAKAFAVFIATVLLQAVYAVINGTVPWPTTWQGWVRYLGSAVVLAATTYFTPTKLSEKQVAKGIQALPDDATERQVTAGLAELPPAAVTRVITSVGDSTP